MDDGQPCEWFLLCTNEATSVMPHPILTGGVPICDRCKAKTEEMSK